MKNVYKFFPEHIFDVLDLSLNFSGKADKLIIEENLIEKNLVGEILTDLSLDEVVSIFRSIEGGGPMAKTVTLKESFGGKESVPNEK